VASPPRLNALVLEVADLNRAAGLYRLGFGIDLHDGDGHVEGDRWIGGRHAALSWRDGAFLHFSLYQAKSAQKATGAQVGFEVDDLDAAHVRALAAGAVLVHEPRDEPWGRTARYLDFDGNFVGLTERRAP
jgi:predicted enzyme related to lactoylglutathione lyase